MGSMPPERFSPRRLAARNLCVRALARKTGSVPVFRKNGVRPRFSGWRVEDVLAEGLQTVLPGEAEVVEPEQVLEAAQHRVVVVRRVVDAAGLDVVGDQH